MTNANMKGRDPVVRELLHMGRQLRRASLDWSVCAREAKDPDDGRTFAAWSGGFIMAAQKVEARAARLERAARKGAR